jgi:hypothetical protein
MPDSTVRQIGRNHGAGTAVAPDSRNEQGEPCMHPITRLTAAAAAALALVGIAQAQTPAQVPGNDSSPQTLSTHRPGETRPQDTVQEVTSPSNATTNATAPDPAATVDSGPTLRRVTPENTPATRADVAHDAAAMNREDALPHGELSLPARAAAPDGSFQRKF